MTPLKKARKAKGWSLTELSARLAAIGESVDTGNLSRIERGIQRPSALMAENICRVIGRKSLTEIHVLYPERFTENVAA